MAADASFDMTDDELLAIALEAEELASSNNHHSTTASTSHMPKRARFDDSRATQSLVDPEWEVIDPTPDIHALHAAFDDRFFQGRLRCVEVRWSKRMTLCAGVCSYEGRGGLCSIRLSEPLLRLRPRKDLVETLLHEEIHAYLFVTGGDRDHDAHGPRFLEHMQRINCDAGTHVSVYHSFHDEVDHYRVHWWRCTGPCRERFPYYGYVKRSMNRAPSARDPWWPEHAAKCAGSFVKVQGPDMGPDSTGISSGSSSSSRSSRKHSASASSRRPTGAGADGSGIDGDAVPSSSTNTQPQFPGSGHLLGSSGTLASRSGPLDRFVERTPRRSSTESSSQTSESSRSIPDRHLIAAAAEARAVSTHIPDSTRAAHKQNVLKVTLPSDSEDETTTAHPAYAVPVRRTSADDEDENLRRAIALSLVEQ